MIFRGSLWYKSKDNPLEEIQRRFNDLEGAIRVYNYYMIETNVNGPNPRTKGRWAPRIILSKASLAELKAVLK